MNQNRSSKPVKVWLFVFLSAIPFVCIYPLRVLKKIRIMMVVNFGILGIAYLASFLIIKFGSGMHIGSSIPMIMTSPISIVIQCICVYNWAKLYNQNVIKQ